MCEVCETVEVVEKNKDVKIPSLLSCKSSVSLKENPDKKRFMKILSYFFLNNTIFITWNF